MSLQDLASIAGILFSISTFATLRRLTRKPATWQTGPWPGLTVHGAELALSLAMLLAALQLALGSRDLYVEARSALPWLPVVAALTVGVLVLSARITVMPGFLSAVCGAYLMPRSIVSLLLPDIAPPPLILPGALLLDLVLWLRPEHIVALTDLLPSNEQAKLRRQWRRRPKPPTSISPRRALGGGAAYGLLFSLLEPTFALLLGAPAANWQGTDVLIAAGLSTVACSAVGWLVATRSLPVAQRPM